jgi:4-diphosphocytidyl-2-C-methyl-D-erythritol kinase
MHSVEVETFAKINLTLDVIDKRADGYHNLMTVMQSVSLSDRVILRTLNETGIRLYCSVPGIPLDRRNTAFRAAEQFLASAGIETGVTISLDKRIPIAAGLAGGSSDAAGVLAGLSALYPNRLERKQLFAIAAEVGADVPFCLTGGTVLCTGIGDIMTPLTPLGDWPVILVKAPFGISTPEVFRKYDDRHPGRRPEHEIFLPALERPDWQQMSCAAGNALESVVFQAHPQLMNIKNQLNAAGALLAQMSGSGPTMFGVFADQAAQNNAILQLRSLSASGYSLFKAQMVPAGIRII